MRPLSSVATISQKPCLVTAAKLHWMKRNGMTLLLKSIKGITRNTKRIAHSSWTGLQNKIGKRIKRFHDFQNTDQALALYNQTHRAKVALPQELKFSDYYKPSPQQKNGELLFIGASTLALDYAAFRFL